MHASSVFVWFTSRLDALILGITSSLVIFLFFPTGACMMKPAVIGYESSFVYDTAFLIDIFMKYYDSFLLSIIA